MKAIENPARRTALDYALAYAALGWAVVPLTYVRADGKCSCGDPHDGTVSKSLRPNSIGKHPHGQLAPHGVHSATKDPERIRAIWTANPPLNVGIALGPVSGIVAVDIDPRDGGDETWAQFVERNGGSLPDNTAIALTGGGGMHILFRYDSDRALVKPGKGVDIKASGGYIVVEPSGHASGGRYLWDAESDPLDGQTIAEAPEWLSSPRAAKVPASGPSISGAGFLDAQRILDLRAALAHLDPDPYAVWVAVGMALHSTEAAEAFEIWDEWSQRSPKYDAAGQRAKWTKLNLKTDGLHVESIFVWARDAGWSGDAPRVTVPMESIVLARPGPQPGDRAAQAEALGIGTIPGVLGGLVDWINATAPRQQPLFAVSTALAIGSVVCGRRYVGQVAENFTSLYFFHLGVSGSGKEFASEAVTAVLEAAEWPELIGSGSSYASDSAVFGALHQQPQHITCTDEIGTYLANAKSEGAMHMRAALSELTKVWGNLHGTLRPKFLSTSGLTPEQAAAKNARVVRMPALTLIAMGQPDVFWPALTENSIRDGFLSRLIIIETDMGRQLTRRGNRPLVPSGPIDWIKAVRTSRVGNLSAINTPAELAPSTIPVPADAGALAVFDAYEVDLLRQMNDLDSEGLANLLNRRLEQSMRVATILAVSVNVERPVITAELARWAVRWIDFHSALTVAAARQHMHGSQFAAQQAEVLRVIHAAGRRGRTERELCRYSRLFNGLDIRQRRSVLDALKASGRAESTMREGAKGGRVAQVWVATSSEVDE